MSEVIILGDTALQLKFRKLALGITNRAPLMRRIGIKLLNEITENFQSEKNEDVKWTPLAETTIAQRRLMGKGAKILQDTGRLKGSFEMEYNRDRVKVGTTVVYAHFHEFGTDNIPKRPFMPAKKRALEIAIDVTERYIAENV